MLLSVLSALARSDIDPWQEAAELAGLPPATATQRLASLIGGLPDEPSTRRDPGTIAARLVALLPRQASINVLPRKRLFGASAALSSPSVIHMIAINAVFMAFLLGAQWMMASHQSSAQADDAHAAALSTVSAPMPSPSTDR